MVRAECLRRAGGVQRAPRDARVRKAAPRARSAPLSVRACYLRGVPLGLTDASADSMPSPRGRDGGAEREPRQVRAWALARARRFARRFALACVLSLGLTACHGGHEPAVPGTPKAGTTWHRVGWIRTQRVDLEGMVLQLEAATGCRAEPKLPPDRGVLRRPEVAAAGCRSRPYEGRLGVHAFDAEGQALGRVYDLRVERGRLDLDFDTLERRIALAGLEPDDVVTLELGDAAWAGTIKFDRLREFRRQWHLHWVSRGRGSPGLFAAAHPDDPQAPLARALGVEAQLARQERDYLEVSRGERSAREFLRRHVWSPYRRSVIRMSSGAAPRSDAVDDDAAGLLPRPTEGAESDEIDAAVEGDEVAPLDPGSGAEVAALDELQLLFCELVYR